MPDGVESSYDRVAYTGGVFPQTHPDRLATIATIHGMNPVPADRCRVLELGCGDASNLIPMACEFPASRFVGLDLAASAIAAGQSLVDQLELKNISLAKMDLMDVTRELGEFDYIVAHGLYSWVPPVVQAKVLQICRDQLAPQGVAYISFNAMPAGHLRQMFRNMMLFHVRQFDDPAAKAYQARALIQFLAKSQENSSFYGSILQQELERIAGMEDGFLFHDDLADFNRPLYFHEFMEQSAQHQLQFLCEAVYGDSQESLLPSGVVESLQLVSGGDALVKEQYMDFLKFRSFRRTLLCHGNVRIVREPDVTSMRRFHIASSATPVKRENDDDSFQRFESGHGGAMSTDHALAKSALSYLAEVWPRFVGFDELLAAAREGHDQNALAGGSESDEDLLGYLMLRTFAAGLSELRLSPPSLAGHVTERPATTRLARVQAIAGETVSSGLHQGVKFPDVLSRRLLILLDGSRTRAEIVDELRESIELGFRTIENPDPAAIEVHERTLANLASDMRAELDRLASLGFLVG